MSTVDFLQLPFAQRALLAALLIGFSNGALGALLVLRKNALVVSALSHALLPGIALGILLLGVLNPLVGFVGALVGALVVGMGTIYVARYARLDHQTALSVLYTTAFAAGLMMMEHIPTFIPLENWLFGNILGLRQSDLWVTTSVSLLILISLTIFRRGWLLLLYEPSIASAMGVKVRALNDWLTILMVLGLVTSLQAVGAVLSAALFITPAAVALQWVNSPRAFVWLSGTIGATSAGSALLLSHWGDFRPGATIILLLGLLFIASMTTRLIRERIQAVMAG